MFKKLLLCFSLVAQSQVIQALEYGDGLSEGFAPRKTALQVLQSTPRYVLDTIKSDLGIGDRVVYDTFRSELAVSVRLGCYGVVTHFLGQTLLENVLNPIGAQGQIIKSMDSAQQLPIQLLAGLAMGVCSRLSTHLTTNLIARFPDSSINWEKNQEQYRVVFRPVFSPYFKAPTFDLKLINHVIVAPLLEEFIFTYFPASQGADTILFAILFGLMHTKKPFLLRVETSIWCFLHQKYLKQHGLNSITPIIAHSFHNLLCNIVTTDFKGIEIVSLHNVTRGLTYPREHLPRGVISEEELKKISPEELMALSLSN